MILRTLDTSFVEPEEVRGFYQFFECYSNSWINSKMGETCTFKTLHCPANGQVIEVEDIRFYEDLSALLQEFEKVCNLHKERNLLLPAFSEYTLVGFEGIINLIKHAIPVGIIYNLTGANGILDLMIVLEKDCTQAYCDFENIVDLALLGCREGTCTIHNYGLLNALIAKGHLFYGAACIEANVIYRKNNEQLFAPISRGAIRQSIAIASKRFLSGMDRARKFYEGAQSYIAQEIFEMATFMLHQACELTYRCLLNVLRDKDVRCHSPAVLRKHLKRFAPEVIGIFSDIEVEELSYLETLEESYIKSRYSDDYTVDRELTVFLNGKVALLQDVATSLVLKKMEVWEKANDQHDDPPA